MNGFAEYEALLDATLDVARAPAAVRETAHARFGVAVGAPGAMAQQVRHMNQARARDWRRPIVLPPAPSLHEIAARVVRRTIEDYRRGVRLERVIAEPL